MRSSLRPVLGWRGIGGGLPGGLDLGQRPEGPVGVSFRLGGVVVLWINQASMPAAFAAVMSWI